MRTRICFYVLLLLPLAVYWQTIFHEYGTKSDYPGLQQAREEPGRLVRETAARGRPLYGAIMETSFALADRVQHLKWLRLCSVLLLTLLALVVWRQLYNSGWNEVEAALLGAGLALLPSSQVLAGWASGWPQALTLVLAVAGFSAIETEIERGGLKRWIALLGGCMIYTAAGLIYQANVLFAMVIVVAVLLVRTGREPLRDIWWYLLHAGAITAGLVLSYLICQVLFRQGVFQAVEVASPRGGWIDFLRYPLPNSLGLYALNDDHHVGAFMYWGVMGAVALAFILGCGHLFKDADVSARRRGVLALFSIVVLAVATCMVAMDRIGTYRILFSLSAVVLVVLARTLRPLVAPPKVRARHYAAAAVVVLGIAVLANRNAWSLMAEPQGREWELMKGAVLRADFNREVRVQIVTPSPADRSTDRSYGDEFGSLSSESGPVAQNMFGTALHARFPVKLPAGGRVSVNTSREEPDAASYDLLIDMRRMKSFR